MLEKLTRLSRESFVYGLGRAVGMFLGFLLLPIYTRIFSPADYGVLDVIATMVALGGIIITAGMETALSYYFYQDRSEAERRSTVTTTAVYLVGVNILVAAVVWIAADPIAGLTFDDPSYGRFIRVAILALPFSALHGLNLNVMRLRRKPWLYLGLSLPNLLLSLALNILLVVVLRFGIMGVFVTNVIANAATAMLGVRLNRVLFGRAFDGRRLKELVSYGLPLVIGGLSMWSINYLDRYFLIGYTDLGEVGLYSVGLRLASAVSLLTMAFRIANGPFQFETFQNDEDAPAVYARTLDFYLLIMATVVVGLAVTARPLLRILAPLEYYDAYRVVAISALSFVAYGVYQLVGVGLLVRKRTGLTGGAIGAGALLNVGFLFALVPPFGYVGAAVATLLTHLSVVALLYVGSQRVYRIDYDIGRASRTTGLAVGVITLDLLRTTTGPASDILAGLGLLALYVVLARVLSLLTPAERLFLRQRVRASLRRRTREGTVE